MNLCFSGHRKYSGTEADIALLDEALAAAYGDGYRTFISGMAYGFDLAAAEAVVRLRSACPDVRLVAAIPFPGQAKGYTPDDAVRYEGLMAAADEVCVLEGRYSHGCYYRRDEWMVDRSTRLVCYYNRPGASGTRYTLRRALARGLEIVNLFNDPSRLF